MAVERLREALRTQDEQRIRACVNACNKEDLQQDHPEMMKAADRLKFLRAKRGRLCCLHILIKILC